MLPDEIDVEERRRAVRTPLQGQAAMWSITVDLQVLDISVAGVLLRTTQPVDAGTRGRLRLNLGGEPLTADIEVRRVFPFVELGRESGYGVGARFLAIAPAHRQLLERLGPT
jgi:PilZ domain